MRHVRGLEKLALDEIDALELVARRLDIRPEWLAAVISFETGGSFDPAQKNHWAVADAAKRGVPYSGAIGLIQFMPSTARMLGTTSEALAGMSFKQQLVFVEKYLSSGKGRMKSLDDVYLQVFYPAAIGRADNYVVGRRGSSGFDGRVYDQNAGFDRDKDGEVTKAEICATIRAVLPPLNGEGVPAAPVPEVLNPLLFGRLELLEEADLG